MYAATPSLSLSHCLPASLLPISSRCTTGSFFSCMQLSGQAVSGTCSSFLKKEKFKEGRWTDVFTGVSEQLVHRGHQARDLDLELETSVSIWIFLAKGVSFLLLWLQGLFRRFASWNVFFFFLSLSFLWLYGNIADFEYEDSRTFKHAWKQVAKKSRCWWSGKQLWIWSASVGFNITVWWQQLGR